MNENEHCSSIDQEMTRKINIMYKNSEGSIATNNNNNNKGMF